MNTQNHFAAATVPTQAGFSHPLRRHFYLFNLYAEAVKAKEKTK